MGVPVTIGPLPSASARAWIAVARESLTLLRQSDELDVPPDVVDSFERYVDAWAEVADASEEFLWSAEIDLAEVRRVGLHWARIATITRVGHPGLSTAGPEAAPFYDAVANAIGDVLAASDDAEVVGARFHEIMPGFDEHLTRSDDEPITVLVADDNDDVRLLLRIALDRGEGFDIVAEAVNGREAISEAKEHHPDVIVLDVDMPLLSGLDAMPMLRELCPNAGIVVFSAVDVWDKALAAGATEFLLKTASMTELLDTVRRAARDRWSAR